MLDKFAEELKEARIKNGISLQQMALKTRIDIKFLDAIDKGDFSFLPEPYVKAFIKDYAKTVGLDEIKVIQRFEAAKKGKQIDEPGVEPEKTETKTGHRKSVQTYDAAPPHSSPPSANTNKDIIRYAVFGGVIILLLISLYLLITRGSDEIIVEEKPFEEIIEDRQRFIEEETDKPAVDVPQSSDSLALVILSSDTSWIKIIFDNNKIEEFILFPNSQKTVKALNSYKITLGNSGGIKFQMNNKPLTFSGKKGSILHVEINRDGLTYLEAAPTL